MSSLNLDVSVLSQSLTVAQKMAIRNALLKIKLQENLSDIKFWGKIMGQTSEHTATTDARQSRALPAMTRCFVRCCSRICSRASPMLLALCLFHCALCCLTCTGAQQDYFIAVSTSITNTITKKFYWRYAKAATPALRRISEERGEPVQHILHCSAHSFSSARVCFACSPLFCCFPLLLALPLLLLLLLLLAVVQQRRGRDIRPVGRG